ncbi:MAG: permease prefix domain 1-containing protein [Planctomycetota bacterium]
MSQHDVKVQRWLDEADAAMSGDSESRRDVLMELQSAIMDRVDERTDKGAKPDEALDTVLQDMGDPGEIGSSFLPAPILIGSHQTRPFMINTALLFAAHFVLVIGATVAGKSMGPGDLSVSPVANPSLISMFTRALTTLLFDAGLMLGLFALTPRLARTFRLPRLALAVRPDRRRCFEGAAFVALVLIAVNFLRHDLLALYIPTTDGARQVPIVGTGIQHNLLFLNVWLILVVARDLLYGQLGEKRWTLWFDLVTCATGLFALLRVMAADSLIDLSGAQEALGPSADGIGAVLNQVFYLITFVGAALLATRVMRRTVRLASFAN